MEYEGVIMAPGAHVHGDVTIGRGSSLWFNAVVRGDSCSIVIGRDTNIQDNVVIHGDAGSPVNIGDGVVIGHSAVIHGCTIGDNTLIGMGSIIMNNARIGRNCIIGAGALVTQGTEIPEGTVAFGSPAKVMGRLSEDDIESIRRSAREYTVLAQDLKKYDESV